MLKPTIRNIIDWWFAVDTPIRQQKIGLNSRLQQTCEQVSRDFVAPSGATEMTSYRRADKVAFAQVVQRVLHEEATS